MMNRAIATLIFLLLLLVGCAAPPTIATWPQDTALQDERYLQPSAQLSSVTISPIADIAEGECVATVEFVSLPNTAAATTPLIFAHGFLREVARHRDWARHIASWGVPVYLVGLCPGGWERGGVNVFAKLLQKTADKSGATQVIYGGFSAGLHDSRHCKINAASVIWGLTRCRVPSQAHRQRIHCLPYSRRVVNAMRIKLGSICFVMHLMRYCLKLKTRPIATLSHQPTFYV
jgi:hypothetical protein